MILPDGSGNRWPGGLDGEHTVYAVTLELLAGVGIKDRGLNSQERHRGGTGFGRDSTREGSDDDRSRLGLPVRVDDRALVLADMLAVPQPGLWVDGFTDRAEDAKRGKVMPLDVLCAETTEKTNSGWRAIEVGELVLGNSLPVAGWRRIDWSRFEHAMGGP